MKPGMNNLLFMPIFIEIKFFALLKLQTACFIRRDSPHFDKTSFFSPSPIDRLSLMMCYILVSDKANVGGVRG